MEAERYSLTLHFSASIFLPLSVAGPANPSSLGVLRSMSFGCGGAALGSSVVSLLESSTRIRKPTAGLRFRPQVARIS